MSGLSNQPIEELARYYGWDEELTKLLLLLPHPGIEQFIQAFTAYDKDGWRYILPGLSSSASVLCLDTRFGTTAAAFAETGAAVTAIHPCPVTVRIMQHRLAAMNVPNVNVMQLPSGESRLPFTDKRFDAFIHHDVAGALATSHTTASNPFVTTTETLIHEAFRILKPEGFSYFGINNRFSYTALKKTASLSRADNPVTQHLISARRIKRLAKQAGFQDSRIHPYMVEHGRVCEIIPATGYRSTRNSFSASKRFKQVILGKIGSAFLAPAYGLVLAKGRMRPSQLRVFAEDLASKNILAKPPEGGPDFKRYLPLHGKVIATLGKAAEANENIIIVIPKIPKVLAWRSKEIAIVNEVRALFPDIASKLPRLYVECSCHGEIYFALSEIPGITIDRRVPRLDRLTCNAVEFLIRFNRISAQVVVLRGDAYSSLIGDLVKQVADLYPETQENLMRIERLFRLVVMDKPLTTVWLHGDYKLENLIFNKNTLEIAGIIDWEHSRKGGLPWLDLLYLVAYNRIMVGDRDFFDVYRETILGENFTGPESSIIEAYAQAMPVAPAVKTVLTGLFFMHHIGCRYEYSMRREGDRRKIFMALGELEKRLTALSQ